MKLLRGALMWSKFLCSFIAIALLAGTTYDEQERDPFRIRPIMSMMSFDEVEFRVTWMKCGQQNAFYFIGPKLVVLCTELQALEHGVIRFILTHELSHAVIMQRKVPLSQGMQELAADELAMVMLGATGRADDLRAAARYFASQPQVDIKWDTHASNARRAHKLRCIANEVEDLTDVYQEAFCGNDWADMVRTWVVLLKMG
jgi:hypothetical protein